MSIGIERSSSRPEAHHLPRFCGKQSRSRVPGIQMLRTEIGRADMPKSPIETPSAASLHDHGGSMSQESSQAHLVPRRDLLRAAAGTGALLFATGEMTQPAGAAAAASPGSNSEGITAIYSPLDPEQTLILFADLQAGIIERGVTNELPRLRRTVSALAKRRGYSIFRRS